VSDVRRRLDRLERRDGAVPPHVRAAIQGATDAEILTLLAEAAAQVRDEPFQPTVEALGPSHRRLFRDVSDEQLLAELAAARAAVAQTARGEGR
jgi:hypothetical protein